MRKYCGKINIKDLNKPVIIYGWVDNIKKLSKNIFLILRDREGDIQILFDNQNNEMFKLAKSLTKESCVKVTGVVQKKLSTNNICEFEILATKLKIINYSYSLPIYLKNIENKEETNLKYRYLYLRNKIALYPLKIRSRIVFLMHYFFQKEGFLHIETPILTNSTPEGARDYLVPSRFYKNKFFALPQSPQLFKQILMISGIDKYYQIVKCFRDEDLRTNRQPEFTQLDLEASFISSKTIRNIIEKMIKFIFYKFYKENLNKFKIITYKSSLEKYGTDKPDLRNPIIMGDVTNFSKKFRLHNIVLTMYNKTNKILYFKIPLNKNISFTDPNICNIENILINTYKINNFFWVKIYDYLNTFDVSTQKYRKQEIYILLNKIKASSYDFILFFQFDKTKDIQILSDLRLNLGNQLNLFNENINTFVWVINFPLFKINVFNNNLESVHHPFTAPINNVQNLKKLNTNPLKVISDSYDLIMNGQEIGGGSVRINNLDLQKKIFHLLNISPLDIKNKFDFFLEALKYGTPNHAGFALGLDRFIMLLTKSKNIKDVIAFPKTNKSNCLLTNAPTIIEEKILSELNLNIT